MAATAVQRFPAGVDDHVHDPRPRGSGGAAGGGGADRGCGVRRRPDAGGRRQTYAPRSRNRWAGAVQAPVVSALVTCFPPAADGAGVPHAAGRPADFNGHGPDSGRCLTPDRQPARDFAAREPIGDAARRATALSNRAAGGQQQPRARVGLDDVRRGAAGVRLDRRCTAPRRWRHPDLDAVSGRDLLEGARRQAHGGGDLGARRGWPFSSSSQAATASMRGAAHPGCTASARY